ncbi:putative classical arabinogalactan protein 5-like [Capsicum annuum]|uniref:agamous-like MADS-box protein AGL27 isoform X1 n=1 Tax=Capsicum annuum TaxID=4072 RepID=UPI0007BEFDCF|nr:agamous-like MADS-box protein AGL27 isoform X1 [Capsicum annuum]KAF3614836.1 putative classical arabinogalactan protein 5-like [Capsicum annuum]
METCGNIGLGLKKKKEIGRRKLEIKRIQDKNCRQVAFCKRRQGLIKKANELSILCNVDVGVVIISKNGTGRLHEYSSTNSVTGILQRYESHVQAEKEISGEHSMYSSMKIGELLQTAERQLEETNADGHTVTDLIHLQNELQTSLTQIRSKKTQLMLETVKDLLEKEKQLREEKKILKNNRARMKKKKEEVNGMSDLPPEG